MFAVGDDEKIPCLLLIILSDVLCAFANKVLPFLYRRRIYTIPIISIKIFHSIRNTEIFFRKFKIVWIFFGGEKKAKFWKNLKAWGIRKPTVNCHFDIVSLAINSRTDFASIENFWKFWKFWNLEFGKKIFSGKVVGIKFWKKL